MKDRVLYKRVSTGDLKPEHLQPKMSKRLNYCLQFLTKQICPGYTRGDSDCDLNKLGYYSLELALATFEYERKGDFDLAHPVEKQEEKDVGEETSIERDIRIVNNLFVTWVLEYEEGKRRREEENK